MKEYNLYFNNTYSKDISLVVAKYPSIPMTTEQYEEVEVEGRNGNLIINKGTFKDKKLQFTFRLTKAKEDYWEKIDRIHEWLDNIKDNRLIYDREDRCLLVKKIEYGNIDKTIGLYGEFTITFICEPFYFSLNYITKTITSNNTNLFYKGNINAEPIISIYGNGNISITINDDEMQITNVKDYVEVNTELLQTIDSKGNSKDCDTIGDFPMLNNGKNTIIYSGDITKIIIKYKEMYR